MYFHKRAYAILWRSHPALSVNEKYASSGALARRGPDHALHTRLSRRGHITAAGVLAGDLVITGGVDTLNDIFMFMCFSKTPALSHTGACRPFSDQADGPLLGAGLGKDFWPDAAAPGAGARCTCATPW